MFVNCSNNMLGVYRLINIFSELNNISGNTINSAQSLIQEIQEIKPTDDLYPHSPFHITHQSVIDPLLNDVFTQSFYSIISVFKITNTNKDSDDKFDKYCCNLDKKNKHNLFLGPHCNSINVYY